MDRETYKRMMGQAVLSETLIQTTKNKMLVSISNHTNNKLSKEKPIMIKRSISTAAIVALAVMLLTATAFAAWYFLKPSEVAEQFGDHRLSAAFKGDTAININQSVTSGGYTFTLLSIASGNDVSDMPFYSDGELNSDRTYAVLAIHKTNGMLIDRQSDDYIDNSFFVSPLIKGTNPALVNIMSMNGTYSETVTDGIIYRIIECDNVEIFADRGLYLAVCSGGSFFNWDAFSWNEQSGEIKANPNFSGASAVFDLPIDQRFADPTKAEQYMKDLLQEPDADIDMPNQRNSIENEEPEPPTLLPKIGE